MQPKRFTSLSNPWLSTDETLLTVNVDTDEGSIPLSIPLDAIPDIVEFLVGVAGSITPDPHQKDRGMVPIPVLGLGLQAGRNADETLLVVRLGGGADLAFPLTSTQLVALADDFAQTARALSAGGRPQ